jgi:hypothetical protein
MLRLLTAALIAFAPLSPPPLDLPCVTPDGSVTKACTDCGHNSALNGDSPQTTVAKCGYPGTVASAEAPPAPPQAPPPPLQPTSGLACETPDGSVTKACTDCGHNSALNGDSPQTTVAKCGYPGTVAPVSGQSPPDDPCKVPVLGEYCDHPVQIPVQVPR